MFGGPPPPKKQKPRDPSDKVGIYWDKAVQTTYTIVSYAKPIINYGWIPFVLAVGFLSEPRTPVSALWNGAGEVEQRDPGNIGA